MMVWLLKKEGYPSGVVVALLLHALLIYIVMPNKFNPEDLIKIEQPSFISATVTKDNPQRTRQLQERERQRQQEQASERRTREAARAAEEQQKKEQAQLDANKKEAQRKLEAEAQAKKQQDQAATTEKERQSAQAAKTEQDKQETARREVERQRQVAQEQAAREAAEREASNQAAAQSQALSAENQLIAQYTAIIRDIVEGNWIQPPNTRNGMQAMINIKLAPSGDIVSSVIVQSSGDAVFDRSALQAVDKAERFPELRDLPPGVFERNFRDFNLLFSPEGLLR
jgi:colicin import membrane protein